MSEGKNPETTREIAEDICARMDIFPETYVRFIEQRIRDAQQPLVKALEAIVERTKWAGTADFVMAEMEQAEAALTAAGRKP